MVAPALLYAFVYCKKYLYLLILYVYVFSRQLKGFVPIWLIKEIITKS